MRKSEKLRPKRDVGLTGSIQIYWRRACASGLRQRWRSQHDAPQMHRAGEWGGLMRPYYEEAGITIYCGDCREVLPSIEVDAIVTDPPYGMAYVPLRGADGSKKWQDRLTRRVHEDDKEFNPAHLLLASRVAVLWGAQWYAHRLPASGGWIVWDKTPYGRKDGFFASDCDMAWTNCRDSIRKFSMQWGGEARGGEVFWHPTQKPVPLMSFCISLLGEVKSIVDPYCGSGPTLAAARLHGIPAIGIEIEERYCEIAANRLRQSVLPLEAPEPPPATPQSPPDASR
jgi:hypothetical protein